MTQDVNMILMTSDPDRIAFQTLASSSQVFNLSTGQRPLLCSNVNERIQKP